MGAELQAERDSEYQYELSKLCGYLFDGFGAENKTQETMDLRLKNSELRLEYYENVDKLTDKKRKLRLHKKKLTGG